LCGGESMQTKRSGEVEAARALFDHVRDAAAVAVAAAKYTCVSVPGRSFCVRIAAGSPSGLGKWLLREGCARRGHGSRGLVVPIDGRYGSTPCSRWVFAQGLAEALRAQGIRAYADRLE
jgi:hypothetical protein